MAAEAISPPISTTPAPRAAPVAILSPTFGMALEVRAKRGRRRALPVSRAAGGAAGDVPRCPGGRLVAETPMPARFEARREWEASGAAEVAATEDDVGV